MRVDLFDFELSQDRIALRPVEPRDRARMLVVPPSGSFEERIVRDLLSYLRPGDALVINDTRVIHARLSGKRIRGELSAGVEATLIERLDASRWRALMRPAKKLVVGDDIRFFRHCERSEATESAIPALDCVVADGPRNDEAASLVAQVEAKGAEGEITLHFALTGSALDTAIEALGEMPLPPYIAGKRAADERDETDYQTVFAREAGAVAAPTAGLHFTPALLSEIEAMGVTLHRVTLHVGAGTFLPVKADDTDAHKMHEEFARIDAATAQALNAARSRGGRIIAVGTTALRTLESAASAEGEILPYAARTSIFITPGYKFRATDMLLTNFHLPRSTLFMLVCAFCGVDRMKAAYTHAIANGYRFYSYGDASLLYRADR
ncbi:tRNA preQ1(34) S-adenosylmethionine ribosyltransferase-isomerase QueA [Methylocystis sp. MJC1]|uniref:tRNA preQ1(34) S-adenosylmethionine ribosyltransferase-isomerase QueA n=1 Tax=Methylocystis sp. MJC1 TaxID=2654282 RepID=UPI0013ED897A|nr:tRNA preQ1(34) S-adenosylmethionine ribosyltransferase-isomerase QueA [Methylocystis sp. MJC1]KAF2992212.1 S-adenosylmethionine:tRNA ribosyltransferase-isomerase [Methylocystis sp. MJC1]MBU6527353.1 tRNA preQ1(34) S-adenosylmethionine ribosyltransferase-isomerase QueA [Methylocystis sp. MJC1]UZX10303.1 tRNA preQ1(34) S-adenosylmethionine ribosyltransferase-isomerase QueA [Methylocystis sp. MJC1]